MSARRADVWRPLLSIADEIDATTGAAAREAAVALHGAPDDETDLHTLILRDLRTLFDAQRSLSAGEKITSEALLQGLIVMEHRPWADYRNGKPITKNAVAKLLGSFGIKSTGIRAGESTVRGYLYADCLDAFDRYLGLDGDKVPHVQHPIDAGAVAHVAEKPRRAPDIIADGHL